MSRKANECWGKCSVKRVFLEDGTLFVFGVVVYSLVLLTCLFVLFIDNV